MHTILSYVSTQAIITEPLTRVVDAFELKSCKFDSRELKYVDNFLCIMTNTTILIFESSTLIMFTYGKIALKITQKIIYN